MATDNETMAETTTTGGKSSFPEAYIRLRTVLDALEIKALQYVLEDKYTATRIERAAKIEALVINCFKELLLIRSEQIDNPCGDGFHYCDGVCVPYNCP